MYPYGLPHWLLEDLEMQAQMNAIAYQQAIASLRHDQYLRSLDNQQGTTFRSAALDDLQRRQQQSEQDGFNRAMKGSSLYDSTDL